ncbi:leukemia inhibitory factor receptor-like [Plectropomus leopardus]|uniref:leukemia inhibitory factor receptor-like n=1 Tax=Plectropomus leopardus TaxID=160734 RepID=UPI001C4D149A|nr:leukemia inhibitory factor receptor-like [Plectropomus leopardus]
MIQVSWEDQPSCSTVQDVLIYEVVVLIADKQVHYEEVTVMPDQIGSTHFWNWSSYFALECASVKLRARYKNHTSLWKQERTLPVGKISKRPEIFPKDRELKVGSNVTFCCILPEGQVFDKMFLNEHSIANKTLTKISNQIYDLTVHLNQASEGSCTNVECKSNAMENGTCAYIGYPPQDSNLQCETRDLKSVECHWTVGRKASIKRGGGTEYHLLGR